MEFSRIIYYMLQLLFNFYSAWFSNFIQTIKTYE